MKNEQLPIIDLKVKQPPVLFTKTQALIARLSYFMLGLFAIMRIRTRTASRCRTKLSGPSSAATSSRTTGGKPPDKADTVACDSRAALAVTP
jgi:hypothetical protein